jgi:hypothetical protein
MRRPTSCSIGFATLLSALTLLTLPACFSLPHVDPGNRVLDDFDEDAGLVPTWSAFSEWGCTTFWQDAGLANPDGGQPVSCDVGPGAGSKSLSNQALVATINVVAPIGTDPFGAETTTRTRSGSVNLSGFTHLLFDTQLYFTMVGQAMLPSGPELKIAFGCSTNMDLKVTPDEKADITIDARGWQQNISLALNPPPPSTLTQSCLSLVDSITFKVFIGSAATGTPIAGTLELDNISFR